MACLGSEMGRTVSDIYQESKLLKIRIRFLKKRIREEKKTRKKLTKLVKKQASEWN